MHFDMKNTLKSNRNHTPKQTYALHSLMKWWVWALSRKRKGKQKRKHQNDIVLVYGQNNTSYSLCI